MDQAKFTEVLWDIDPIRIADLPSAFVVRRVLAYGSVTRIFQLIRMYSIEVVRNEFSRMKISSMDPRRHQYLKEFVLS